MNYSAFGEYTALCEQARAAAFERAAWLFNLAAFAKLAAEAPSTPLNQAQHDELWAKANAKCNELQAAVARANEAAALCGKPPVNLSRLLAERG